MLLNDKRKKYLKKKLRTKQSLGTLGKYPRLVVFKSNRHIYGQLLDDNKNITIFSSSSMDNNLRKKLKSKSKVDKSIEVGYDLAEKIKSDKIKITKLAQGLPVGGEIEQLDDGTLFSAFKNRVPVTSD